MIADFLYNKIKDHEGRLATTGIKHIFRLHAWELKHGLSKRFTASVAMVEQHWSEQCADMMGKLGAKHLTKTDKSGNPAPMTLPEKLEQIQIGRFRQNLDERVKERQAEIEKYSLRLPPGL